MTRLPRILLLGLLATLTACGGYSSSSEAFRRSMQAGAPQKALTEVNLALGVDRTDQMPTEKEADTPLLLLERATILQAMGNFKQSARDFQLADKWLDVLDLTSDTLGSISKYLFSDDAKIYKSPPHEKLLLNTLNMVNYLAMGDASGAKVEARRLVINQKYLDGEGEAERGMLALSSYLAGYAFEVAGEGQAAMRHYGDAVAAGGVPTLKTAVRELNAYSGATDERVKAFYGEAQVDKRGTADVLVVMQTGMAPYKIPHRVPVAQALIISSRGGHRRNSLSAKQRARANTIAAKGLVTWVNYPSLQRVQGERTISGVAIDGQSINAEVALDVEERVIEQFEQVQPSLVAAALTRVIARAAAGAITEGAARSSNSKGGAIAMLAGLLVQGAMVAADTPDTRAWVTLPGRISVARTRVPPGAHTITVRLGGVERSATIDAKAGGFNVLNFSAAR